MTFDPPPAPGGPPEPAPPDGSAPDGSAPAWWEDGRGWEGGDGWGTFPRRRRSRVLQVAGLGVVAALLLGSIGTTLEVVFGGSSAVVLPATVTSVVALSSAGTASSSEARATTGSFRVTFSVANPGGGAVVPACRVTVVRRGRVLGRFVVPRSRPLAGGAVAVHQVVVPVGLPARARVACQS